MAFSPIFWGGNSFEKAAKLKGEGNPLFFESFVPLPLKPQPLLENDLGFHPKNPTFHSIVVFFYTKAIHGTLEQSCLSSSRNTQGTNSETIKTNSKYPESRDRQGLWSSF